MQVNLNTNNYGNSNSFRALKHVEGENALQRLIGEAGPNIVDFMVCRLKENNSFKNLCEKCDVFVNIKPDFRQIENSILLDKGLVLDIYARKIRNKSILNLFRKKEPLNRVSGYMAAGIEAKTWKLADYIIDNFIKRKGEKGMSADIDKFLNNLN